MDRAFPLDETHHLRNRIFRRNRDQYVNMIRHQMPLQDLALLLARQPVKHFTKMFPELPIQHFPPIFRYEYNVILALPTGVT